MLWFSIGLPGRFAQWCDAVLARLVGETAELRELAALDAILDYRALPRSLDQLTRILIGSSATDVVIAARQPDMALHTALAEAETRFVVALEHPRVAAADMLEDTGAEMRLVTRAVANSCALVMRYPPLPGALTLHGDAARADPVGTVLAIARHLGSGIGETEARHILDTLASSGRALAAPALAWSDRIPDEAQKTVGGAFAGYEECFAGRGLGRIVWNRDLFFAGESEHRATGILEIPEGASVVFRGPYIQLPPGSWTARVHLGFSQEAVRYAYVVEIHAEHQLVAAPMQPQQPGIHAVDLGFGLGESGAQGIEFRINIASPEARGRLAFGHVMLTPAAMLHPEAATDWEEEFRATLDFSL